jgi:putative transposase
VLGTLRRKVAWCSTANHLRVDLVLDTSNTALYNRRPAPGLTNHTGRGSQYASIEFGNGLKQSGILHSMAAVAAPYDNSLAASLVSTFRREPIHQSS